MHTDNSDLHECTAQIHAQQAASGQHTHEALVCPYCDCQLFYEDEKLLNHVYSSHGVQIRASGMHKNSHSFRELLRNEALHKAQQAATMQPQPCLETPAYGRCSPLTDAMSNLSLLSLQGSPDCLPDYQNDKPVQANGITAGSEPRIVGNNAVEPERCSRGLEHRTSCDSETTQMCTKPQVTARNSHAQPRVELPYPVQQQDSKRTTSSDNGSDSSVAAATSRSLCLPASYQTHISVMPTNKQWPDLVLPPDPRPVSQEQLARELKKIYAGITIIESKCKNADKQQPPFKIDLMSGRKWIPTEYWHARIALHRTLLHEHHDFFLASQHPSASPALRRLAAKYSMSERMWKHGIHSFLELLRQHRPETLEYMITFIYDAYQMMVLLLETVPAFEGMWIQYLGDLARYRMAIEGENLVDRETWAEISVRWYNNAADKTPMVGRIYHHLATLARPNTLQQLYLYCRALMCVQPFMSTRESISSLSDRILGPSKISYPHCPSIEISFVRAHALLFEMDRGSHHIFEQQLIRYIEKLDSNIRRLAAEWKQKGAHIAISNIAGLFDYGREDNFLRFAFATQLSPDDSKSVFQAATPSHLACRLAFDTLHVVLQRLGDMNVLPHLHILLAFLSQAATLPYETSHIFSHVKWEKVALFLNALAKLETITSKIESSEFLHGGNDDFHPLPEDYIIRGQLWAYSYYPVSWFNRVLDEEERILELASTVKLRTERILWLGVRLGSGNLGLRYDGSSQTWHASNPRDMEE
ncbi:hypothetical protein MPH_10147 [Macrophomina phaseolina MS6]|uniref:DNA/RNA-binding domain-containing protein n=1 Tax=Macrophomina phaseolina (strain MS6) TaxID=1126212 RepID=K2RR96_MACPH|nr:hypothetical protein MPH_10147 [Macrophomina phaseolina MS6]